MDLCGQSCKCRARHKTILARIRAAEKRQKVERRDVLVVHHWRWTWTARHGSLGVCRRRGVAASVCLRREPGVPTGAGRAGELQGFWDQWPEGPRRVGVGQLKRAAEAAYTGCSGPISAAMHLITRGRSHAGWLGHVGGGWWVGVWAAWAAKGGLLLALARKMKKPCATLGERAEKDREGELEMPDCEGEASRRGERIVRLTARAGCGRV